MSGEFGIIVREARESRGLSQEKLAELVGTTQSTIDRIENGSTQRSRYMHLIAEALGLNRFRFEYIANFDRSILADPSKPKDQPNFHERTIKLSMELHDRVRKYMIDYDVPTEEEAYRIIINEGLMQFDHFISITDRLYKRLREKHSLRDAARHTLGGHPKVSSIIYGDKSVNFKMVDGYTVEMNERGVATVLDPQGEFYEFSVGDVPDWAAPENIDPPQFKLGEQPDQF